MFYERIRTRLPKYSNFFKSVGEKYDLPWKLLAAIAYQESHWNPNAKSFTGVRGMMMLTNETANLLGVKNRVDPLESIVGGTRHIKQMIKMVPQEIEGENRLKFALAAYNVGMGHIHDARELAKRLGYNPNIWSDLKKVLPLLSKKKYYTTLKYGYARGEEPVKYVESIYDYRDILENHFIENPIKS
jgi:membrane-bound lytic murein transglycosylase F